MIDDRHGWLSVRETLRGKHLLLTGVTGFLGKVFVAYLLETTPDLGKITLLVRGKKGQSTGRRARHMLEHSPVFRSLKERHGENYGAWLRTKLDVVAGDVRDPLCGIDPRVLDRLGREVDAVVHIAGLTDFSPDPHDGLAVNTHGAEHAAEVAARTQGRRLLHVSTCFVAGNVSGHVAEKFEIGVSANGTRFSPRDELGAIESLTDAITRKHAGDPTTARKERIEAATRRAQALGYPNLYTYSKSLAEHLLALRTDLELTFVRPAIVECARTFPFAGWNEGINTSGPLVWLVGTMHRRMPFAPEHRFDVVPVDSVVRGMTSVLAALLSGRAAPVYQLGTSDHNPFHYARVVDLTSLARRREYAKSDQPFERFVLRHLDSVVHDQAAELDPWLPAARKLTKSLRDTLVSLDVRANLPRDARASFGEPLHKWVQKTAKSLGTASRTLGQVENMLRMYQPFVYDNDPEFETTAIRSLEHELVPEEREAFRFDTDTIDWRDYWMNVQVPGLDKWSLPLLRGERVSQDPGVDLGGDPQEWTADARGDVARGEGARVELTRPESTPVRTR